MVLLVFPGELIGKPVRALIAKIIKHKINKNFPEWRDIVELGANGFIFLRNLDNRHFVTNPELIRNGRAKEMGIRIFTFTELKQVVVRQKSESASLLSGTAAFAAGTVLFSDAEWMDDVVNITREINISNSLLDINPASGLPTVGGMGTPDVAGNNWGENHNI